MAVTSQDKINSSFAPFLFVKVGNGQNKFIAVHGLKLGRTTQKHEGQISNFQFQRSFAPVNIFDKRRKIHHIFFIATFRAKK